MEHYNGFWLEGELGNCAFANQGNNNQIKLWVAPLVEKEISALKLGKEAVFCEKGASGEFQVFCGLEEFLHFEVGGVPIYIFDNHNHALYFWYREWFEKRLEKGVKVVHIDQHSDMKPNLEQIDEKNLDTVFVFTQQQCNVGNFIIPALNSGLIGSVDQVRSEYGLLNYKTPDEDYILDIDMDFWEKQMGIEDMEGTFRKVRSLIVGAKMVSIATSPYFLDQKVAIELLKELFEGMNHGG